MVPRNNHSSPCYLVSSQKSVLASNERQGLFNEDCSNGLCFALGLVEVLCCFSFDGYLIQWSGVTDCPLCSHSCVESGPFRSTNRSDLQAQT